MQLGHQTRQEIGQFFLGTALYMTFQLAHLMAKVKSHLGAHQVTPASSQVNELSRIEQEPQPLAD